MAHQAVFVYGSLRRGSPWHFLLAGSSYLDRAVLYDYALMWRDWYPAAVRAPGCRIEGELYLTPQRLLERLDDYEEVPSEYVRARLPVRAASLGTLPAWVYVAARHGVVWRGCSRGRNRREAGSG